MDRDFRVAGDPPAPTHAAALPPAERLLRGTDKVAVFVVREDLEPLLVGLTDARIMARTQAAMLVDETGEEATVKREAHLAREAALGRVVEAVERLR